MAVARSAQLVKPRSDNLLAQARRWQAEGSLPAALTEDKPAKAAIKMTLRVSFIFASEMARQGGEQRKSAEGVWKQRSVR